MDRGEGALVAIVHSPSAISANGKFLAAVDPTPSRGQGEGQLVLYDLEKRRVVQSIAAHTQDIWSIAFSPDSKRLVSSSRDTRVRLWEVESGKEVTGK